MPNMKLKSVLAGICLAAVVAPSQARDFDSSGYFTLLGGYTFFDEERNIEDDPSIAAGLGYEFNRNFAAEVLYGGANLEPDNGATSEFDGRFTRLDVLYHFDDGDAWRPFLIGGGGNYDFSSDGSEFDETQWNLGAGLKHEISDSTDLRFDARGVYGTDNETKDVMLNLGINMLFAGLVVPPEDSDGDGIYDDEDRCPDTPYGAKVDTNGCEIIGDADNDGVKDDVDQCPNTPAGAQVDEKGCAADEDGDGIADVADKCPGTPAGTKVDETGCPADKDGDGVMNSADACPDTPAGAKVDARGCQLVLTETVSIKLNVNFPSGSAIVPESEMTEVEKLATFLRQYPSASITVEGHTDSQGSDTINQVISEQRADAVRDAAIQRFGADPSRISAVGMGEAQPIADNNTAEGRRVNRRVVGVAEATAKKE